MNTQELNPSALGLAELSSDEMADVDGGAIVIGALAGYLLKGAAVALAGAVVGYVAAELID